MLRPPVLGPYYYATHTNQKSRKVIFCFNANRVIFVMQVKSADIKDWDAVVDSVKVAIGEFDDNYNPNPLPPDKQPHSKKAQKNPKECPIYTMGFNYGNGMQKLCIDHFFSDMFISEAWQFQTSLTE